MDFYTLKWGDQYGPEYVNRLYGSLKKHYKKPNQFRHELEQTFGMKQNKENFNKLLTAVSAMRL